MQYYTLFSLIALVPAANCIAFGGPVPTDTSPTRALEGWTPKPTQAPSVAELRKRQRNRDPETCGWVDGDAESGITCSYGRTCMLYSASSVGMAGCCSSGDTQNCGWASSCIDYNAYFSSSRCNSACERNTFIRKCSNIASPYCVTWTYPADSVADYGCTDISYGLIESIYQTAVNSRSSTTSMTLSTLTGNAVTGYRGTNAAGTPYGTEVPSTGGSSGGRKTPTAKKVVSMGLIIGAVVGGLILLFIIGAIVIFICVKQKKKRQLAANQQAIASAQATRPQSQHNPQMQQPIVPMQPQPPMPPMTPQTPQPQFDGYFKPAPVPQSPQPSFVQPNDPHKYGSQTPISNPPTPAPPYVQPYFAAPPPPMPTQSPGAYPMRGPTPGAHEVDAISVPHAPNGQQGQGGQLYEMGSGK